MTLSPNLDEIDWRASSRFLESSIEPALRKRLGQHFTGELLARVLAGLAVTDDTRSVVDPMAGTGDLLDAVVEAADARGQLLEQIVGAELDLGLATFARNRLQGRASCEINVHAGDAFDHFASNSDQYDLVIANPPYVRYQTAGAGERLKGLLRKVVRTREHQNGPTFDAAIDAMSGHSDLAVPSLILSAALVKPGGLLALIVPASWRSRKYAFGVRGLLAELFDLQLVVEDTQPGWFPDAQVRTNLLVARRGHSRRNRRDAEGAITRHVRLEPSAFSRAAQDPGAAQNLSRVLFTATSAESGVHARQKLQRHEWDELAHRGFIFDPDRPKEGTLVPAAVSEILGAEKISAATVELALDGVQIAQGLRTGCNEFFYVKIKCRHSNGTTTVETSKLLNSQTFRVPNEILMLTAHKQGFRSPLTGLLYLEGLYLPEDIPPMGGRRMPDGLAEYVRRAANTRNDAGRLIPELSAVRTNVSLKRHRTWYHLPTLAPRHRPDLYLPRVIGNDAMIQLNPRADPLVVDANFTTLTVVDRWTPGALRALLSSTWAKVMFEHLGTPMGGGALKLEATQLRHFPVPRCSDDALLQLCELGCTAGPICPEAERSIDEILAVALTNYQDQSFTTQLKAELEKARGERRRSRKG